MHDRWWSLVVTTSALTLPRRGVLLSCMQALAAEDATAVFSGGDARLLAPVFAELKYKGVRRCETGEVDGIKSVRVSYDPQRCSYKALLGQYWRNVDPQQADQQFPLSNDEKGAAYRTVIWVASSDERRAAEASKELLEASGVYGRSPFKTEIRDLGAFVATPGLDDAYSPTEVAKIAAKSGRAKFFEDKYKPVKTTACADGVCGFVFFPCSAENRCLDVVAGTF